MPRHRAQKTPNKANSSKAHHTYYTVLFLTHTGVAQRACELNKTLTMSHNPSHRHGTRGFSSAAAAGAVEGSRASQEGASPATTAPAQAPALVPGASGGAESGLVSDRRGGGRSYRPQGREVVGAGGILKEHSLGMYYIRLGRLQHTSHARQLNAKNAKRLRVSLETNDYMDQHPLSVTFKAFQGAPSAFTQKDIENAGACTILDRNHRVAALRRIKGDDFLVPCQCYSDIQDVNVKRIVADGKMVECKKVVFVFVLFFAQING